VTAVLLLAAAAAGVYAANLRIQLQDVELRLVDAVTKLQASQEQLDGAANELDAFRTNLGLLGAPDAVEMKLSGRGAAAKASGRLFVSAAHGLLIALTGLPPLTGDQVCQVWLLGKGKPVSAGVMHADQQGNATAAFDLPPDAPSPPMAVQVTVESGGGADAPTGQPVVAAP
jgi:anti-sigma-K factor RskA